SSGPRPPAGRRTASSDARHRGSDRPQRSSVPLPDEEPTAYRLDHSSVFTSFPNRSRPAWANLFAFRPFYGSRAANQVCGIQGSGTVAADDKKRNISVSGYSIGATGRQFWAAAVL